MPDRSVPEINDPEVIAEVTAAHHAYEAALVGNDIAELNRLFWDSDDAVRFGATEALYGTAQIAAFRRARSTTDLARTVSTLKVVSFGRDTAISTVEFDRRPGGVVTRGRQTQVWRKFEAGWKIVSAHISFVWGGTSPIDHAARLIGLSIPAPYRAGVESYFSRAREAAQTVLDFPLDDTAEVVPVFRP